MTLPGSELARRLWAMRLVRFLVVGGVNTVFGYSIFAVVYLLSDSHIAALIVSVLIGVTFNFFSIGAVVFRNLAGKRFVLFCLNYAVAFSANYLMLEALVATGMDPLVAQMICLPAFIAISYGLNARFVFRQPQARERIDRAQIGS
jgi:putative flippase GtrA